ncbi:MAG: hypothetical protein LV473_11865 [Nitrospira sp.]|nr:hypothetical protein [Nitrospira sp.]
MFNRFEWLNRFGSLDGLGLLDDFGLPDRLCLLYRLGYIYFFFNRLTFRRLNGLFRKSRQACQGNLNGRKGPFTMSGQSNPCHHRQYADMQDQRNDDGEA